MERMRSKRTLCNLTLLQQLWKRFRVDTCEAFQPKSGGYR